MAINYKKCPRCGSRDVIKFLYGEPTLEALFMEAQGKIKLGGCLITNTNPEYYCNNCKNEWNKKEIIDREYGEIIGIRASVGGYFQGHYEIDIDFISRKLNWEYSLEPDLYYSKTIRKTTLDKFIEELKLLNILNWKNNYIDSEILDGTQWEIEIRKESKIRKITGDNKFPKKWNNFCKLMELVSGKEFK